MHSAPSPSESPSGAVRREQKALKAEQSWISLRQRPAGRGKSWGFVSLGTPVLRPHLTLSSQLFFREKLASLFPLQRNRKSGSSLLPPHISSCPTPPPWISFISNQGRTHDPSLLTPCCRHPKLFCISSIPSPIIFF